MYASISSIKNYYTASYNWYSHVQCSMWWFYDFWTSTSMLFHYDINYVLNAWNADPPLFTYSLIAIMLWIMSGASIVPSDQSLIFGWRTLKWRGAGHELVADKTATVFASRLSLSVHVISHGSESSCVTFAWSPLSRLHVSLWIWELVLQTDNGMWAYYYLKLIAFVIHVNHSQIWTYLKF